MKRQEALDQLHRELPALTAYGVSAIWLFGSTARDQATDASDVDVLVELAGPDRFHQYLDVRDHLNRVLGRKVDVVMRGALKPWARPSVEAEAIRVA